MQDYTMGQALPRPKPKPLGEDMLRQIREYEASERAARISGRHRDAKPPEYFSTQLFWELMWAAELLPQQS